MKKVKPEKKGSLTGKLLRLLKPSSSIQESISLQEKNVSVGIPSNSYHDHHKEIKTALVEAERKKAEALMELQRRKFIC